MAGVTGVAESWIVVTGVVVRAERRMADGTDGERADEAGSRAAAVAARSAAVSTPPTVPTAYVNVGGRLVPVAL